MAAGMNEAEWEGLVLEQLADLGWEPRQGKDVGPGSGERENWGDVVLRETLIAALKRINPQVPPQFLIQAAAEVVSPQSQDALTENQRLHAILRGGYRGISYVDHEGREQHPVIYFLSQKPENNIYQAVNQVTVRRQGVERRFDVLAYVNGLPLVAIELKAASSASTAEMAYNQLSTYLDELPMAFRFTAFNLVSDGISASYGTPFTPWNHYATWNVDEDGFPVDFDLQSPDGRPRTELETSLDGLFNETRFLQLFQDFIAFDKDEKGLAKRIAKPHQYFAVTKAVGRTVQAVRSDGRIGVVWHTQGSGKSMEMEMYAARVMRDPHLANPTLVVVPDRTELDSQFFDCFQRSQLLPEPPTQVGTREELRTALASRITGGIYFTTLQKFGLSPEEKKAGAKHPLLSDRRNIIVMVDEAHRSHYDDLDGYARHLRDALPHASHIAFTGTPVRQADRDTRQVFGADIDVYDLQRAVEDGATVPVFFEPRLIPLAKAADVDDADLNAAADELTVGLDDADRQRIQRQVAALELLYGAPERIKTLAADVVEHWERRREAVAPMLEGPGKAMIVVSTRSIAARLYEEIIALRPAWASDEDTTGKLKVVYSASPSDPAELRKHMRRTSAQKAVKNRLKDPSDELELVIVKDMMLTGFDAPSLHTLYLDRALQGALLMQTLARVNRTFRGKEDGLLVAYAPLMDNLTQALQEFTHTGDDADPNFGRRTTAEAAAIFHQLIAELRELITPDWKAIANGGGNQAFVDAVRAVVTFLRSPETPGNTSPEDFYARPVGQEFRIRASRLQSAWALARGDEEVQALQAEVRFYQEVRAWMARLDAQDRISRGEPVPEDMKRLLASLVTESAEAGEVVDIYAAAGLGIQSLAAFTPQWAAEATQASDAELKLEALRHSLLQEMNRTTQGNEVRSQLFADRVNELMFQYTNRQLTAAEIIAKMLELAAEVQQEGRRGESFTPPLAFDELAFYDVVAQNPSAVDLMGDDVLAQIARDLVAVMQRDIRTDWTVRDDVKAKLRSSIRRLLRKYKYPPDKQSEATAKVIEAMEKMAPRYASEQK